MRSAIAVIGVLVLSLCWGYSAQAVDPGLYDITVQANEDYRLNLTHTANGLPVNLTGYSFRLQAKKNGATPVFLTFSSAVTSAPLGKTSHWLTRATTAANAGTAGTYDLMQTAPDGTVTYKLKGQIKILETVTR